MPDDSWPLYLYTISIIAIMIFNALVVACKRALDYIDRNVIKDNLENDPDNKRLKAVTRFLSKPSAYHYADHAASFISIITAFVIFNTAIYGKYTAPLTAAANLGFYIVYTSLSDILPKKLAAQSSDKTGVGLIGFQKVIYVITLPIVWLCKGIANFFLRILGKDTDVDDSYFSEDKVMSMLDRGRKLEISRKKDVK